ncbi:MAG: hypothetical protein NC081_11965 [Roseburia sp.]|nr:hypothetical protein [Roseburia sp.]
MAKADCDTISADSEPYEKKRRSWDGADYPCGGFHSYDGAVGMVHMYHKDVQDRCVEIGLTTHERIRKISTKKIRQ